MNLANKLMVFRLLLVIPVVIFLFSYNFGLLFTALLLFILIVVIDKLDGYFARKERKETKFGAFFDPLIDKVVVHSILISFVVLGIIPLWMELILLARDLVSDGLRSFAMSKGKIIKSRTLDKVKGMLEYGVGFFGLIHLTAAEGRILCCYNLFFNTSTLFSYATIFLMFFTIVVGLYTLYEYLFKRDIMK